MHDITQSLKALYKGYDYMTPTKKKIVYPDSRDSIKSLKKGEFFRLPGKQSIYIKGDYDRSSKKYEAIRVDDIYGNCRYLKSTTKVDINFEY